MLIDYKKELTQVEIEGAGLELMQFVQTGAWATLQKVIELRRAVHAHVLDGNMNAPATVYANASGKRSGILEVQQIVEELIQEAERSRNDRSR